MRLLVLDTSNSTCCAGLYEVDGGNIKELSYRLSLERRTHSEVLLPITNEVINEAGIDVKNIDLYAVTVGPGSFTGIRIGIATVKGMSVVTDKKVVGVTSVEALARSVTPTSFDGKTYILPCFDARNNRVFAALYDEDMNVIVKENGYDADELTALIDIPDGSRLIICGNGCETMSTALEGKTDAIVEDAHGAVILPSGIAKAVAVRSEDEYKDAIDIEPVYCARASAERLKKATKVHIKDGVERDVPTIVILEAECIKHPWTKEEITDLVRSDRKLCLVARTDNGDAVVGYCGASFVEDEAEVGNLCVSGKYRREGIGLKIMTKLMEELKEKGIKVLFLEVSKSNEPAVKLYEKLGFTMYSSRKDYYGQGDDALLYKIEL